MNHLSSSKNNVWPCIAWRRSRGRGRRAALAHAWRPASCQPQGKEEEVPRRGLRVASCSLDAASRWG